MLSTDFTDLNFMFFMVRKKVILCGLKTFLCVLCGKEVRLKAEGTAAFSTM